MAGCGTTREPSAADETDASDETVCRCVILKRARISIDLTFRRHRVSKGRAETAAGDNIQEQGLMNIRVLLVEASSPLVFVLTMIGCGSTSVPSEGTESAPAVKQLPVEGEQSCKAAHEWVTANEAHLPTSYDALARYSMVYRKAIFSAAPQAVKANLWKEHFGRYRAEHALSPEQASVLDRALALIDSELASWEPRSPVLKALEADALKAFGPDGTRDLLGTLGPTNDTHSAASQEAWDCECSVESSLCGVRYHCGYTSYCEPSSWGCGDFWLYPCDGICFVP